MGKPGQGVQMKSKVGILRSIPGSFLQVKNGTVHVCGEGVVHTVGSAKVSK